MPSKNDITLTINTHMPSMSVVSVFYYIYIHNICSVLRPGFVRVNLPYFYDDETCDYIINAVDMVATHGWRLLPQVLFSLHLIAI